MEDFNKETLKKIMERQQPDMSHIKPPTTSAAEKMVKNLHSAGKKVKNKKPESSN